MRIKQFFRHRSVGIWLLVILFFAFPVIFNLSELYSKNKKSVDRLPDVSMRFDFDKRLEARPYRVFLVRDKDLHKIIWEWKEPILFQFYQPGKTTYDFYNIKPGIYWVGITFRYLQKNWTITEWEYVRPGISTGIDKETQNRIEIRKKKPVIVDLIIQVRFVERPDKKTDKEGYFRFVERCRPKSPEEGMMMDENYFSYGMAGFENVRRSSSKDFDRSEIFFLIDGFDDYPFENSKQEENK